MSMLCIDYDHNALIILIKIINPNSVLAEVDVNENWKCFFFSNNELKAIPNQTSLICCLSLIFSYLKYTAATLFFPITYFFWLRALS